MSTSLRDALARRIDEIGPPDLDVQELVGLGERRSRRRRLTVALGSGAAVVLAIALALGGASLIRSGDPTPGPADHHTTDRKKSEGKKAHRPAPPAEPQARKIVYSDGPWPTRTLHVGDRTVDISDELSESPRSSGMVYLDTTGDGVVLTTDDGRIWFTDGTATQSIGQLGIRTRVGASPIEPGVLVPWQHGRSVCTGRRDSWSTTPGSGPRWPDSGAPAQRITCSSAVKT